MNNQEFRTWSFGEFFRSKRLDLGLTLRDFSLRYGYDPGNISRLERNILSPTLDEEKLKGYAKALQLKRESPEWVTFFDLAHVAKGTIPKDIRENENIATFLPAFYRSARGKRLTKTDVEKIIQLLNEANVPKENESY
jgi:transcriptional regulator with XRE-family HTH domain